LSLQVPGPSPYRGKLLALTVRIDHAVWVLTSETRPQAFEAEMLAPAARRPALRTVGEEIETMVDLLHDLNRQVLNLIAEEEAGSLG
jgi:hypothetical protein